MCSFCLVCLAACLAALRPVLRQRHAGSTDDARPAQPTTRRKAADKKIDLHGLAADFAFQLGSAGLSSASGLDPGAAVGTASGSGKGSLDAVALHLCLPVTELFAFYLEFACQGRTRLAGFEPPDGRQLAFLCESFSRQSNLLTVPWSIVPSFPVSFFGYIPVARKLVACPHFPLFGLLSILNSDRTIESLLKGRRLSRRKAYLEHQRVRLSSTKGLISIRYHSSER